MLYNRLLPLLVPLFAFASLEAILFNHRLIYAALAAVNLAFILALWRFTRASSVSREWWRFAILPVLHYSSLVSYVSLLRLSNKIFIQFLFAFSAVLLYFYFRFCYYYLLRPLAYKVASIENLSSYAGFLSFYFVAASLYGLEAFLNMPLWPLESALALLAALQIYQLFWVSKIPWRRSVLFLVVACLSLIEISWALSFLPLSYHVAGLSLAICFYVLVSLGRLSLLGQLARQRVKYYIWFAGLGLALLWLTARWL